MKKSGRRNAISNTALTSLLELANLGRKYVAKPLGRDEIMKPKRIPEVMRTCRVVLSLPFLTFSSFLNQLFLGSTLSHLSSKNSGEMSLSCFATVLRVLFAMCLCAKMERTWGRAQRVRKLLWEECLDFFPWNILSPVLWLLSFLVN